MSHHPTKLYIYCVTISYVFQAVRIIAKLYVTRQAMYV